MPGSNPVEPPANPVEPPEPVFRDLSNDPRLIQVSFTRKRAVDRNTLVSLTRPTAGPTLGPTNKHNYDKPRGRKNRLFG